MQSSRDRWRLIAGWLLVAAAAWTGCFSDVKRRDASDPTDDAWTGAEPGADTRLASDTGQRLTDGARASLDSARTEGGGARLDGAGGASTDAQSPPPDVPLGAGGSGGATQDGTGGTQAAFDAPLPGTGGSIPWIPDARVSGDSPTEAGLATGGAAGGGTTSTGLGGSGGVSGTGGTVATGGTIAATGGTVATGGTTTAAGGTVATGGTTTAAGGTVATGGTTALGGASGTGGIPVVVAWGKKENPTAHCPVGPMPAFSSLVANPKLPDPFTKMDGTRIKDKSEWACRRQEILQQGLHFIYGDKPIPAGVTGTVSSSRITVNISEGDKTATINATVSMNGATQPAPAIIRYGNSGASAPSGVATINFSPTETTGGSGAKSGAFFSIYGSNHPAGYMVSNAWEVSRIIDVIEKNPGVIDPYRLGVTGCSRWGKGAFVAGVLDNRIALTIPVESGIAGTAGLRLVEQLDPSGEWPYHAISYVRWLSEVALGPFTTSGRVPSEDNTDKLPVDIHEMMALIVPRGLYIVDNPDPLYVGLDINSAWVTASVGKVIFEALGVGDNFTYHGAPGAHCEWRAAYDDSLSAMIDKFLLGNASARTGSVVAGFTGPDPNPFYDWTAPTLSGQL